MKTPMQELLERVKEYRDSETSPLVISRLNSVCVDIVGMLEKEKALKEINKALHIGDVVGQSEQLHSCKYVKREGESCTLNNNCKYPNCD